MQAKDNCGLKIDEIDEKIFPNTRKLIKIHCGCESKKFMQVLRNGVATYEMGLQHSASVT